MNGFLLKFTSNKKLMKIIMRFMNFFQEGSIFSYILLLIKYIPLVIITHEWKLHRNFGLNALFVKLSFSNYVTKETNLILSNLISYFLISLNFTVLFIFGISYSKLTSLDVNIKRYKILFLKSLYVLCFLNFFCSQFFYELCSILLAKNWYHSNIISNISGVAYAFKIVIIPISLLTFISIIAQNYLFTLIIFRPYYVKRTFYANRINSLSYKNILYPLLIVIVAIEPYVSLNVILYIKIIFRIFYIYHFVIILMSNHLKQYYLELFVGAFCFVSVIIEFIFIKEFFEIDDEVAFLLNPQKYSLIYNSNFFYSKLFTQILLAGIICLMTKIYEFNFLTNFFENIKGKFTYCFYNKNFEFLTKLKHGEVLEQIMSLISKNNYIHVSKCNDTDCLCGKYKKKLNHENQFDSKLLIKNLISLLEINLKENLKRHKHSNSETYTKYLMIDTIYSLYFKKHYAKCFFNIEKMQRQPFYKKNYILKIQVFWLKYEVIVDFIKFNKTSSLATFRKMRENYEKYNTYKDLEIGFMKTLKQYKNLITLFFAKNLNFSDFYEFLEKFYISIFEGEKLIKFIITNHDQHNSLHITKIDFITKFLKGENTFIPLHKMEQYLNVTDDDKTEKLIVKHTNKKEFLIDYISPKLAEQLSLKTSDIIGYDIHKFMSPQFVEFHYSHIVGHIKNNMLLIKNKEIYFVDKHGYCVNYFVDGSVLITLSGEILVYIEVKSICEEYHKKNISFISCDEEGELIAINKKFAENFYIDVNVKNVVQPNLFKNILNINKSKLNFVNNQLILRFSYSKLIKNIRAIDYSKLWDFNNINYFKYLENLNKDKYFNIDKVELQFQISKRNLQEKFFFYDLKINIYTDGQMTPMNFVTKSPMKINPNINTINPKLDTERPKIEKMNSTYIKRTAKKIRNDLNKIKLFSIFIRKWGKRFSESRIQKQEVQKDIDDKLEKMDLAKIQNLKYSNSFIRMIIFILVILGVFLFLGDFTVKVFNQVELFGKMRMKILKLKQKNYYIINSIYSINIVTGKLQPDMINIKNLNYSSNIDNSILYHLNSLKKRRDNYQDDFHYLLKYYLNLDEFLMNRIASIFNKKVEYKSLANDWTISKENSTFFDVIEYDYRGISKILSEYSPNLRDNTDEIIDFDKTNKLVNKFLLYNSNNLDFNYKILDKNNSFLNSLDRTIDNPPTLRDKNMFYFLENSIFVFKSMYDRIKEEFDEVFESLVPEYRTKLITIFIIICVLITSFFIFEGINFYYNYNKVFEKYFILHDILKKYMDELFIKIELLEELFLDFTDSNKKKYYKLSSDDDFMKIKITQSETFKESYSDVKNKIMSLSENKSSINKSFLSTNIKANRLLDYYENNNFKKPTNKVYIEDPSRNLVKLLNPVNISSKGIKLTNTNKIQKNPLELDNFNYFDLNNIKNLTKEEDDKNEENNENNFVEEVENHPEKKLQLTISNIINEENENEFNEIDLNKKIANSIKFLNIPTNLPKKNLIVSKDTKIIDNDLNKKEKFELENDATHKKQTLSLKKSINEKRHTKNNKTINNVNQASTLSTFNKTDSHFLPIMNTNTNLNSKEKESYYDKNENDQSEETVRKSNKYYLLFSLFWIQLIMIFCLIIINIDNTGKRFEKMRTFNDYSEIFFKRIILSTEMLMIYQMSIFNKISNFLIEESDVYINKIYNEIKENEKKFLTLNNDNNKILSNLKDLEFQVNLKDNFCKFLSENLLENSINHDKNNSSNDYFTVCKQVSQNFFSVGFSKAMENLFNYMKIINKDLSNFFRDLKIRNFDEERIKLFLNDFYYVFSSLNQDRIIYGLYEILDQKIINFQSSLQLDLENLNNLAFYSLYVLIILLGIFSICKTKSLIQNSNKLIDYTTDVVENGIKFTYNN